jgi:predicted deacylase
MEPWGKMTPGEFHKRLMKAAGSRYKVLGKLPTGDVIAVVTPTTETRSLVSGGFHGNEPAGALSILRWIEEYGPAEHTAFIPLMNPTGFERGVRYNVWGDDPNRGFTTANPSLEGEILLAYEPHLLTPDGTLMLHEDPDLEDGFYIYTHPGAKIELPAKIHAALFQWFRPLSHNESIERPVVGLVPHDKDTSFEDWMLQHGVAPVLTVETPAKAPMEARIGAHMDAIRAFIEYIHKMEMPARVARRWSQAQRV